MTAKRRINTYKTELSKTGFSALSLIVFAL